MKILGGKSVFQDGRLKYGAEEDAPSPTRKQGEALLKYPWTRGRITRPQGSWGRTFLEIPKRTGVR